MSKTQSRCSASRRVWHSAGKAVALSENAWRRNPILEAKVRFPFYGGRRVSAGFKKSAGDCVVRFVAIATGLPYQETSALR
jgi:hypothetical protein